MKVDMRELGCTGEKPPLIKYHNITVIKNGHRVLDNINLSIDSGEHVAILGPNGAGKSSFLKTITRDYYPLAGIQGSYLRILGEELWDVFELRSHLGIVSGEILKSAYRDVSCQDMVLSGFLSSVGIWQPREITPKMERKAKAIMEFLGISSLRNRSVNEVSSGESRLVLIGRALVHNPSTLLFDEPTANLDPKASYELRQTLRRIASQSKGIIMITHNLSDIIPEINRIILISEGRIVDDGSKDRILTKESLSKLFGIELEVVRRDGYYYIW
jgi:iron complex transport system ATP-binding protein